MEGDYIYFVAPKKVGVHKLKAGIEGVAVSMNSNQTAIYPATKGAIEILSITETEVTGRIDARYNGSNLLMATSQFHFALIPGR